MDDSDDVRIVCKRNIPTKRKLKHDLPFIQKPSSNKIELICLDNNCDIEDDDLFIISSVNNNPQNSSQKTLLEIASSFTKCHNCNRTIVKKFQYVETAETFIQSCKKCGFKACIGCGEIIIASKIDSHCSSSRLVQIVGILVNIETVWKEIAGTGNNKRPSGSSDKPKPTASTDAGIGCGSGAAYHHSKGKYNKDTASKGTGTGYGSGAAYHHSKGKYDNTVPVTKAPDEAKEILLSELLRQLLRLLPNFASSNEVDLFPHPDLTTLLTKSCLFNSNSPMVVSLLRNDCFQDILTRWQLVFIFYRSTERFSNFLLDLLVTNYFCLS
jgi:hypothetical protein